MPHSQRTQKILRQRMGFEPGQNPLHTVTTNPYDIRPALTTSMAEIEHKHASLEEGQKLIILFGETHDIVSHKALQEMICTRMQKIGLNPLVAIERPYNEFDPKNPENPTLLWNSSKYILNYAPYSTAYFFHKLWKNGVSTKFIDTACKTKGSKTLLDGSDKETAETIQALNPKTKPSKINAVSALDVYIRNAFMLKKVFEQAGDQHNVMFLSQGAAHIFGSASLGCAYSQSSHGLLQNHGFMRDIIKNSPKPKMITILPHDAEANIFERQMPIEAYKEIPETIIPTNLSENSYRAKGDSKGGLQLEKRCLTDIYKASGDIATGAELPSLLSLMMDAKAELNTRKRNSAPLATYCGFKGTAF